MYLPLVPNIYKQVFEFCLYLFIQYLDWYPWTHLVYLGASRVLFADHDIQHQFGYEIIALFQKFYLF